MNPFVQMTHSQRACASKAYYARTVPVTGTTKLVDGAGCGLCTALRSEAPTYVQVAQKMNFRTTFSLFRVVVVAMRLDVVILNAAHAAFVTSISNSIRC